MFRYSSFFKYPTQAFFQKTTLQQFRRITPLLSRYFCDKNASDQTIIIDSNKNKNKYYEKRTPKFQKPPQQKKEDLEKTYQEFLANKKKGNLSPKEAEDIISVIYQLAFFAKSKGEGPKAERYYRECLDIAKKNNITNPLSVVIYNDLGELFGQQGNAHEALRNLDKGKELLENPNLEDPLKALERNLLLRGMVYKKQGKFDLAIEELKKLLERMKENEEEENDNNEVSMKQVILLQLDIGSLYYQKKEFAKAAKIWEEGINVIKEKKNLNLDDKVKETYKSLAFCCLDLDTEEGIIKAKEYFEKYVDLQRALAKNEIEDSEIFSVFLFAKFFTKSNPKEFIHYINRFFELANGKEGFEEEKIEGYFILSIIYTKDNKFQEARDYFNRALSSCAQFYGEKIDKVLELYVTFFENIPTETVLLKEYKEEMVKLAERCLEKGTKGTNLSVSFLFWAAHSCIENKDWEKAVKYFEGSLKLGAESVYNTQYMESLYNWLFYAYYNIQNYERAMHFAQKGKKISEQYGLEKELENYNTWIQKIKDAQGVN